jgi:hypothetical protein
VASILEEKQASAKAQMFREEKQERMESVRKRLGLTLPEPVSKEANEAAPKGPDVEMDAEVSSSSNLREFFLWLSSKFDLRAEEGGSVIYRTHWFVLIKRIWIQTILVLIVITVGAWHFLFPFTPLTTFQFYLILLPFFLGAAGWWYYDYLDWWNDRYIITDDQVIDVSRRPLGKEEKRSAPLRNILSIEYERLGVIGLALNFGTVFIRIGDDTFTFDYVSNPSEVQRELFARLAKRKRMDQLEEMRNDGKLILDWIEAYHIAMEERWRREKEKEKEEDD